jgi:hypothetical protein
MQDILYNSSPSGKSQPQGTTLQRVPLGYYDLEHDNFTPISQEQVLKMIQDYGDKLTSSRPTPANGKQGDAPEDTLGCWFCVDVFLKLMGIKETEKSLRDRNAIDPAVSGIRIYFARSGDRDTVVMLTTERETEPSKVRVDKDRVGPGQRVVYVDDKHKNPDGGSICPPPYGR